MLGLVWFDFIFILPFGGTNQYPPQELILETQSEGILCCDQLCLSRGRPRLSHSPAPAGHCLPKESLQAMPVFDLTQTTGARMLLCLENWCGFIFF